MKFLKRKSIHIIRQSEVKIEKLRENEKCQYISTFFVLSHSDLGKFLDIIRITFVSRSCLVNKMIGKFCGFYIFIFLLIMFQVQIMLEHKESTTNQGFYINNVWDRKSEN